jgi:hypothetical protein
MSPVYSANQEQSITRIIFDSLTRCFHPADGDCSPLCSQATGSQLQPRSNQSQPQRPQQEQQQRQQEQKERCQRRRRKQQDDQQQQQQHEQEQQHHADHYIHRKLEIFRTTEEECLREFGVAPGSKAKSSSHTKSKRREHKRGNSDHTFVTNSDDEIKNLTDNLKRSAPQRNGTKKRNSARSGDESRMNTFLRLLNDPLSFITNVQKQYDGSLCFATPVRAASKENVAKMSDWMLTAGEFSARYEFDRGGKCGKETDVDESTASQSHWTEDETITSASYFDQKYSHLVETSPPMLLFDIHRVVVSERETDTILTLAKNRQKAYEARKKSDQCQKEIKTKRSSPCDLIVGVVTKTSPHNSKGSSSKKSNNRTTPTKGDRSEEEYGLTPDRESSSISSNSQDGEQDDPRRCQQPRENFRKPELLTTT